MLGTTALNNQLQPFHCFPELKASTGCAEREELNVSRDSAIFLKSFAEMRPFSSSDYFKGQPVGAGHEAGPTKVI